MKRILITAVAAAAVLAGSAAAAAPAMASTGPARSGASPISTKHPDTTSASGRPRSTRRNGPVWAYDNARRAVHGHAGDRPGRRATYQVDGQRRGSFQGFADPRLATEDSTDPVARWPAGPRSRARSATTVTSPVGPERKLLPAQEPDGTGLGTALRQLFGGQATSVVPGSYDFQYNQVAGAPYEQVG